MKFFLICYFLTQEKLTSCLIPSLFLGYGEPHISIPGKKLVGCVIHMLVPNMNVSLLVLYLVSQANMFDMFFEQNLKIRVASSGTGSFIHKILFNPFDAIGDYSQLLVDRYC